MTRTVEIEDLNYLYENAVNRLTDVGAVPAVKLFEDGLYITARANVDYDSPVWAVTRMPWFEITEARFPRDLFDSRIAALVHRIQEKVREGKEELVRPVPVEPSSGLYPRCGNGGSPVWDRDFGRCSD